MVSTYTPNINLEKPALGDYVNDWNVPVNSDWTVIDQALGSTTSIAFTNANVTLTVAQSAYYRVTCTGTLTGDVQLIFPSTIGGRRIINNTCTGAHTLTVLNGAGDSGGGVVIPQATQTPVNLTGGVAYFDIPPITPSQLAPVASDTVIGNATGGTASPTALTQTQLTALINAFTSSLPGSTPASGGGVEKFLRADATWATVASSVTSPMPQGRLTLISATPVLSASSGTGVATIYYTPYIGQLGPLWNGTNFVPTSIPEISISVAALTTSTLYDVFYWYNGANVALIFGPTWTNATSRSAGTAIARVQGVLVNSLSISGGPAAGYGTYVGTIAVDAAGATVTFNPNPAAASGGPSGGAWVGLWNQYNRVDVGMSLQDSAASWTYSTNTWRSADNSNNNRVTFVSGQAEDSVSATYGVNIFSSNATNYGYAGLALDATNAGTVIGGVQGSSSTAVSVSPTLAVAPQVGRHFIQATEISVSGTTTYSGGAGLMQLSARLRY